MTRFGWFFLIGMAFAHPLAAQDMPLSQVLIDGQNWELVSEGHQFTEGPAADAAGNVFFSDIPASKIHRVDALTGRVSLFAENTGRTNGLMFGPDGRLYGCSMGARRIVAYDMQGNSETLVSDVDCNDLVVNSEGDIYFTDPPNQQVWFLPRGGEKRIVATGYRPNGVILWPDQGTLVVTDSDAPHLWAYRVERDGSLSHGERWYGPLAMPPGAARPGSDGMTVDREGRLYVTTAAGLQMFDTQGRPSGVIRKPQAKALSNVAFGGPKFDLLYVTSTDKVYRRPTKTQGVRYGAK